MKWNNLVNVGVIVTWHIKGFSALSDMLYSAVYWQVLISLHRKGDLPQVVRLEGSAAIVGGQLLQIHRLSDHSALQQGSGVDHLLQACVSVPLTGASSSHTRTHTHTCPYSSILHAQSDPICAQSVDRLLSHGVSAQAIFPLICLPSLFPFPSFLSNSSAYETITAYIVDD